MSARIYHMPQRDALIEAIGNLRSGLLALASMLNDAEESPPPHQMAELLTVFADSATYALGDAAPMNIRPD